MKFKAAILEKQNAPLSIRTIFPESELKIGQVLVRVHASGICGAQLGEIAGVKGEDKYMPHLLGHEGAGRVIDCGPGVTLVKPGDRVVMHWRKGAGIEAAPAVYRDEDNNRIGAGWVTTFNEYAIVSENRLTRIDAEIPYDIAALMGCAVTTGLGLATHEARVKIGESVIVFGCGGVGLNVIQGLRLVSAYPIVGVDVVDNKLQMAKFFGATDTINSSLGVEDLRYFDVAIDTTGDPRVIEKAYQMLSRRRGGRLFLVGQVRHDRMIQIQPLAMHSGVSIHGSDGGDTNPTVDIPRYLALFKAGLLKLKPLITNYCSLPDINEVLDSIRARNVGRAIVQMEMINDR